MDSTKEENRLSDFINNNKGKLYERARNNTTYNAEGKATISRNDEWFNEQIWDEGYKKGTKTK